MGQEKKNKFDVLNKNLKELETNQVLMNNQNKIILIKKEIEEIIQTFNKAVRI